MGLGFRWDWGSDGIGVQRGVGSRKDGGEHAWTNLTPRASVQMQKAVIA